MANNVARKQISGGRGKGPGKRDTQLLADMAPRMGVTAEGIWHSGGTAYALYDFSTDGGAVGDILLGVSLPANAIVTGVTTEEVTDLAGASSTVAIKAGSSILVAAAAITGFANVQQQTVAGHAKPTSAAELTLTVAVGALTAGKLKILVSFIVCA